MSDRTGDARPGVFASAIPKVNVLEPAFVVSVGDLIEGYTEDQAQIDREWDEFQGFIEQLEVPFFYAAGNHDMSNAAMAETWQARFGPSFYRFVYKDVLFVVLNSELFGMVSKPDTPVPGPWTQVEQLAFVERTLAEVPDPRWTIVIVHQPLWDYGSGVRGDWPKVEAMLEGRRYTVFAGHFHHYVKVVRPGQQLHHPRHDGGWQQHARKPLRGIRPCRPRQHDRQRSPDRQPDARRHPRRRSADGGCARHDALARRRRAVRTHARPMALAFSDGRAAFQVTNAGDRDLAVSLHVDPGPDLLYTGTAQATTIPAGGANLFTFDLRAGEPLPYRDIRPGRVFWSLSTHTGANPVDLHVVSALLPVAPLPIPSGSAPSVDGDLGEWDSLPYRADRQRDVVSAPTAATDIAYSFAVRESDGDLYVAVRVSDDSLLADEARGLTTQDSVMITVDSRPDPERSANLRLYDSVRRDLAQMAVGFVTLRGIVEESYYLRFLEGSRAAVASKATATEAGYDVEFKVDGAFLDRHAGESWKTVRLAIAAIDWDAGDDVNEISWHAKGSDGVALHWMPDRFGEAPVAASGTFTRSVER